MSPQWSRVSARSAATPNGRVGASPRATEASVTSLTYSHSIAPQSTSSRRLPINRPPLHGHFGCLKSALGSLPYLFSSHTCRDSFKNVHRERSVRDSSRVRARQLPSSARPRPRRAVPPHASSYYVAECAGEWQEENARGLSRWWICSGIGGDCYRRGPRPPNKVA